MFSRLFSLHLKAQVRSIHNKSIRKIHIGVNLAYLFKRSFKQNVVLVLIIQEFLIIN